MMSRPSLSSESVAEPSDRKLAAAPIEPSAEVDARTLRLAHAALLASHSALRIARWELALSSALIACYAVYAAAEIFKIFSGAT
jgi:hypothetical protein